MGLCGGVNGAGRFEGVVALAVALSLCLLAAPLRAAVTFAEYNGADLNAGSNTVAAGSHELPAAGTLLYWEDATAVSALATWEWFTQAGTMLATQPNVPVDTDTAAENDPVLVPDTIPPNGALLELYEGRTQVLTRVGAGGTFYLPATAFNDNTGADLFFDTDQGPPDHPDLESGGGVTLPQGNGIVILDPTYGANRAQVEFNLASQAGGLPFEVDLNGILENIPTNPSDAVSAEVWALVRADIVRIPGGSVAPLPATTTVRTHPWLITWPSVDWVTTPPVFDVSTPGEFDFLVDFTGVVDGTYEIRLTATDVRGNSSPPILSATSTVITVVIDRGRPQIEFTAPPDPLIIGATPGASPVYEDGVFTAVGRVSDVYSLPALVDARIRDEQDTWEDTFTTLTLAPPNDGIFSLAMNLSATGTANVAANQPAPGDQVFWILEATATDAVGNVTPTSAHLHVIYDLAATEAPEFSFPGMDYATAATTLDVVTFLDNNRAGGEELEEHGTLLFELTVYPAADPTRRTTFTFNGQPSATRHDSSLDDNVNNQHVDDPLGTVPDSFTGTQRINLDAFPDGVLILDLVTVDQVGNRSAVTQIQISKGRTGPVLAVDLQLSGPDDNYDVPGTPSVGQPPNQFGADDLVFIMSLRSPETEDPGDPPGLVPVPFPLPDLRDNGDADTLLISGSFSDLVTGVVSIRGWGPNVPTTSVTITPPVTSGLFTLSVDVRALPEGIPQVVNFQGLNVIGQYGPVQSVVVIRDTVPARAPTITSPSSQPYFTTQNTMVLEGMAEPNALVAVLTPPTTGALAIPIPRTVSGLVTGGIPLVPDPRSIYNSIPFTAQTTRADSLGRWRIPSVDLTTVSTSFLDPTVLLVQAVDVYDNTDPDASVTPVEVFRNADPGHIARVLVDPGTLREIEVYSTPPTYPPTAGQFRGIETVYVQVLFDTLVVEAPRLTVTQQGAPGVVASVMQPVPSTTALTQTVRYQYYVRNTVATYDGPAALDFQGGRDVFGNVISALDISQAFWVDSVAPVMENLTTAAFFPFTGVSVAAVTTVAADVVDRPSPVTDQASGIDVVHSAVELYGPLELNPDAVHPLTPTTPGAPYDLAGAPVSPVTTDGTYRIVVRLVDNVGNSSVHYSTFVLDTRPIDAAVVVFTPECGSSVNRMPATVAGGTGILATVFDLAMDVNTSTVTLTDWLGTPVPTTPGHQGSSVLFGTLVTPFAADGSNDGRYVMAADVQDLAGNPTPTVTCAFVYDTTPPGLVEFDPAEFSCARDPLRRVQVRLGDPPSPLTTNPFTAGVDLDRSTAVLRLRTAWWPNQTQPATVVKTQRSLRIVPDQAYDILALEILDAAGAVRSLADDGTEDGTYEIEVRAVDRAGNTTTVTGVFDYDTQHPRVLLDAFPEDSFFADSWFTVTGQAFDLGPCGLDHLSVPVTQYATTTVQVRVEGLDAAGNPVMPVVAPYFDFQDANLIVPVTGPVNQLVQDRCAWQFTGRIPAAPGRARLVVRVTDAAGNETLITRVITIKDGTLEPPVLRSPADGAVTGAKLLTFQWDPVLVAQRYDLELTRVTPTGVTTSTTFAVPFPTSRFLVDLPLFCSSVPGGAPIQESSIFLWRMRSVDVSDNAGEYGVASVFIVDPNRPSVVDVLINGESATAGTSAPAGVVQVQVDFDDETGMDTTRPPTVTVIPRDPSIGPVSVTQTGYTSTTWTGQFTLPLGGSSAVDCNGPAVIRVRDAFDRAGNGIVETTRPFLIDIGPWFDVRFFANPVNPVELLFTAVPRSWQGGPVVQVPYSASPANPLVSVRQQGRTAWLPVPVWSIPATSVASSAFRGAYAVDRSLLGQVDFTFTAQDVGGRTATRTVSVNVVDALAREGVVFWGAEPGSHLAVPPLALTADATLFAVKDGNGPEELPTGAAQGLTKIRSLGWFLSARAALKAPASIYGSLADVPLPEGVRSSQLGLCRWDGSAWRWLGGAGSGKGLTAETTALGAFAVMADTTAPRLREDEAGMASGLLSRRPTLTALVAEEGSGVEPGRVTFTVDGVPHRGLFDPVTGLASWTPERLLAAGDHTVTVAVTDKAGNAAAPLEFGFAAAAAIAVEAPVAYPNPARSFVRVRWTLTGAARRVTVRFYDVAGAVVQTLDLGPSPAGETEASWDLTDRRGRRVANGVYLYRVAVEGEDGTSAKVTGKLAVLR